MTAPALVLESVSFRRWRGDRRLDVLQDVGLELESGEVGAVWGARSSGKSTLLSLAAGLLEPDSGRVLVGGRDLAALSVRERSALLHYEVGIVTRRGPSIRGVSVSQWVAMAIMDRVDWPVARRRAHEALHRVGASGIAEAGWDRLSDGERTLVAIAHAVVRRPRLLLVDDLNAGLALLERDEVMSLLRSLVSTADTAVLVTTAEVTDVEGATPIWSLAGGRLVGRESRGDATVVDFPRKSAQNEG